MASSEENPPSEPPADQQPATDEKPAADEQAAADVKPEAEPTPEQNQSQEIGDGATSETPEAGKAEEQPSGDQPESHEAGDATIEKHEGEEVVAESTLEKPEGEGTQEITGESVVGITEEGEAVLEEPVTQEFVNELMLDIPQETNEEFVGGLVETIVSEAIDKSSEMNFIGRLLRKIVAHAVGEESSEESEIEMVPEKAIEEIPQESEDVAGQVLKYLLGPESLRFEEERWRPEFPASCICFLNIVEYARRFVDDILEKAKEVCLLKYGVPIKFRKKQVEVQNIRWPSIENFTIDLGIKKIDEYIQMTFEVEENWLYKINFITAQSDLSSDVYLYEAIFCIPTPCYPIAQATVSIYFNCDVSRVKPRECPIDVTYSIESLKETLVPGKTVVNDDMLLRLVYSKLSVFKSLYF